MVAKKKSKFDNKFNKTFIYIHERDNWTNFRWDASEVSNLHNNK